ncbi:uncharacterized protein V1510DRAFT_433598 [Dipodascopsis tothii]|uniref:uncharacterized protein n=1 Tax=Dipodascopsis tothii TaxID=44089 RepID=UPI0034CD0295
MAPIQALPNETLASVFGHLDPPSFLDAAQVSRAWRALAHDSGVLGKHLADRLCASADDRAELAHMLAAVPPRDELAELAAALQIADGGDDNAATRAKRQRLADDDDGSDSDSDDVVALSPATHARVLDAVAAVRGGSDDPAWTYWIYLVLLRRKMAALVFAPRFRLWTLDLVHEHTDFECSTLSADGQIYVTSYRDTSVQPPLRLVRTYSLGDGGPPRRLWTFAFAGAERRATKIALSRDRNYAAFSFGIGYVEVYRLDLDSGQHARVFSNQFPSAIHSLALSRDAEVLVLGCQRLGGLTLVNLQTEAQVDLPHYRLDLTVALSADDEALYLNGWKETIVMRSIDPADWTERESTWDYYMGLIRSMESSYVPLEHAHALETRPCFVGLVGRRRQTPQLRLLYGDGDDDDEGPDDDDDDDDVPEEDDRKNGKLLVRLADTSAERPYVSALSADTSRLLVCERGRLRLFSLSPWFAAAYVSAGRAARGGRPAGPAAGAAARWLAGAAGPPQKVYARAPARVFRDHLARLAAVELQDRDRPAVSRTERHGFIDRRLAERVRFAGRSAVTLEFRDGLAVFDL